MPDDPSETKATTGPHQSNTKVVCSHCRVPGLLRPCSRPNLTETFGSEGKIDRIEARLANIERLLQERLPVATPQTDATPARFDVAPQSAVEVDGYTGPHADSLAAKEAFEQVASVNLAIASDESLRVALLSLRGIIDRIKADEHGVASSGAYSANLPLPPWDDTRQIIQKIETEHPPVITAFFPCLDLDSFCQKCTNLYRSGQDGTIFDRLMVYSGLTMLCSDFSASTQGSESEHNHILSRSFSQHVLKTIDVLPAILTASWEGTEALVTAAFACVEMCKPQLALALMSIAAKFCQTLGYNRLTLTDPAKEPENQRKVLMFWQVYIYDRSTALRVGRPPSIPEYDIATEGLDIARLPRYAPAVIHLHQFWAHVAHVHGELSSRLYSPVGVQQKPEQRMHLVRALAAKLQSAWTRRTQVNDEIEQLFAHLGPNSFAAQCMRVGDDILYYSTLTLVLHALSPTGKPTVDSVKAARACLRAYKAISSSDVDNVYSWSVFCHCVTLYSPLTPFTVLFTHVINDQENGHIDLQLLSDFVESLRPARQVSEGIDRFYTLCSKFYQIAEAYISAKSQEAVMSEFDDYLSTLGLLPQVPDINGQYSMMGGDVSMPSNYQDWYSGNVSLYGLIEDQSGIGGFDQSLGVQ